MLNSAPHAALDPLRLPDVGSLVHPLRAVVQRNAAAAERQRTLPRETVDALVAAGLLALAAPRELGGLELDALTLLAVVEEVTFLDTSAGWATMIANGGAGVVGSRLCDDGAADVFGTDPPRVPAIAGTFAPVGRAVPTGGGYRVSGRWSLASGIRHAGWVTGGCMVERDGSEPEMITVVVPRGAVRVIDTWHVSGLRGTGSDDWEVHDLLVPDRHVITSTAAPTRGGPTLALPLFSFIAFGHAGFALGCARRSLHEVTSNARDKVRLLGSTTVAQSETFQRDIGRAECALDAARSLVIGTLTRALDARANDEPVTDEMVSELRAAVCFATETAVDICTLAFRSLGAQAIRSSSPVQQYLRDVQAAAQHAYVTDRSFVDLARHRLGLWP